MNIVDTSPKIADGSYREIQDETYLYIQVYQWGTWNSIVKLPFTDPKMIAHVRNAITRIEQGELPHQPWPFPTPPQEQPEKDAPKPADPYDVAKRVVEELR